MAIDYIIDYDCIPKQTLGTEGILERLKGQERARVIIQLYRESGDDRPPSDMGFDFTRRTSEDEETRTIVVQDVLDLVAELEPLKPHCAGCPANRTGQPFGCMGFIQYPISAEAERWLLEQLPTNKEPLVWLLLKQGVSRFQYNGEQINALRQQSDAYFESKEVITRQLGGIRLDTNQAFEMIFNVGHIIPNHGAILLLFFNALERSEMEAPEIMNLAPATDEKLNKYPFLHQVMQGDDTTTAEIKDFFHALYMAWALDVRLLVDA